MLVIISCIFSNNFFNRKLLMLKNVFKILHLKGFTDLDTSNGTSDFLLLLKCHLLTRSSSGWISDFFRVQGQAAVARFIYFHHVAGVCQHITEAWQCSWLCFSQVIPGSQGLPAVCILFEVLTGNG